MNIPRHLAPFFPINIQSYTNIDAAIAVVNCMTQLFKETSKYRCFFEKDVDPRNLVFEISADTKLFEDAHFSMLGFLYLIDTLEEILSKHYDSHINIKGITIRDLVN